MKTTCSVTRYSVMRPSSTRAFSSINLIPVIPRSVSRAAGEQLDSLRRGVEGVQQPGALDRLDVVRAVGPAADVVGALRHLDLDARRQVVDTSAHIQGIANSEFSTPKELGRILAQDESCHRCIVKQLFRYAFGREETPADQPAIDRMLEAFRKSGFRFQELIISLVTSRPFLGGGSS